MYRIVLVQGNVYGLRYLNKVELFFFFNVFGIIVGEEAAPAFTNIFQAERVVMLFRTTVMTSILSRNHLHFARFKRIGT